MDAQNGAQSSLT